MPDEMETAARYSIDNTRQFLCLLPRLFTSVVFIKNYVLNYFHPDYHLLKDILCENKILKIWQRILGFIDERTSIAPKTCFRLEKPIS